jgi:hypothetical protein
MRSGRFPVPRKRSNPTFGETKQQKTRITQYRRHHKSHDEHTDDQEDVVQIMIWNAEGQVKPVAVLESGGFIEIGERWCEPESYKGLGPVFVEDCEGEGEDIAELARRRQCLSWLVIDVGLGFCHSSLSCGEVLVAIRINCSIWNGGFCILDYRDTWATLIALSKASLLQTGRWPSWPFVLGVGISLRAYKLLRMKWRCSSISFRDSLQVICRL